jgi:hypothetical protein
MDELINLVVQKTGISNEQARMAVDTVLDFLKSKLPAPMAGQVDSLLAGGDVMTNLGGLAGGLGGLFGKK